MGDRLLIIPIGALMFGLVGALIWRFGQRRWPLQVGGVLLALVVAALVSEQGLNSRPQAARLVAEGFGQLALGRLAVGLLVGGLAALALELVIAGNDGQDAGATALTVVLGAPAALTLTSDSLPVVAFSTAMLMGAVWVRWQRVAGPQLLVRSLGRQTVIVFSALLAAAAILPSVRLGAAPPLLESVLLAGAVAGEMGVLPFSGWAGASMRLGPRESSFWRIWMVPVGLLLEARLVAASPTSVATSLRELLIGLGLATALFWGARALLGPEEGRYPRILACDVGLMCTAIAFATGQGLAAALVLLLVHWLAGSLFIAKSGVRPKLLAWIGISGVPPFGGFAGRILLVITAASFSPTLAVLVLLVVGLQLGAAAVGMRTNVASRPTTSSPPRELIGLIVAVSGLVLGVVPVQALALVLGRHP